MKPNTRWIAASDQFVFNHKTKGCCLMVASVDLRLGALNITKQVNRKRFSLLVLGKSAKSIVGYQFVYHTKPTYTFKDSKMFFSFFTPPSKRTKAKILYQDNVLMVNVFGESDIFSVVLKNKYWL